MLLPISKIRHFAKRLTFFENVDIPKIGIFFINGDWFLGMTTFLKMTKNVKLPLYKIYLRRVSRLFQKLQKIKNLMKMTENLVFFKNDVA